MVRFVTGDPSAIIPDDSWRVRQSSQDQWRME